MVYLLKISLLHKLFLYFHKDINIQAFCISCTYIWVGGGGGGLYSECVGVLVCVRVCVAYIRHYFCLGILMDLLTRGRGLYLEFSGSH